MMKGGLGAMMKQAQQMQQNMQKAQAELAVGEEVEGQAASGKVKVNMTCGHVALRVSLDDSLLSEDEEMLEDLIVLAIDDTEKGGDDDTAAHERSLPEWACPGDEVPILMSSLPVMPSAS